MDTREPITRTTALEQHAQTILAGLLTLGISGAVAVSWRSSTQLERLIVIVERQQDDLTEISRDVRVLSDRAATLESRLTALESKDPKGGG
jgi:hypothetical protein